MWSLVYHAGETHQRVLVDAYAEYSAENALSPTAFPSVARMESEVVQMLLPLVGDVQRQGGGTMTSGGTETAILSLKAHRDLAREQGRVRRGHVIMSVATHPAFHKAAQLLDLEVTTVPVGPDYTAEASSLQSSVRPETILMVASAPCYPYGAIDPISDLGALALEHDIGLHVDACLGGFFLGIRRHSYDDVPPFGLDVPGVTSIGVDLHKFGYGPKGTGAILYSSRELRRRQYFAHTGWAGGTLASPSLLGTRSAGAIAAAWAGLHHLGMSGYKDIFDGIIETRDRLMDGMASLGFKALGNPMTPVFAATHADRDVHYVADRMEEDGWRMDRQQSPDALHFIVQPRHASVLEEFLQDLEQASESAPPPGASEAKGLIYGQTSLVDRASHRSLESALLDYIDENYG